jgi:hypothetical protein
MERTSAVKPRNRFSAPFPSLAGMLMLDAGIEEGKGGVERE